jgi:ATP-dependent Clp protease ATP-binding subunit ClpC
MKYTPRGERALLIAHELARESGHKSVTTGHLLHGLISLGSGVHYSILDRFDLTSQRIQETIIRDADTQTGKSKPRLNRISRSAIRVGMNEAKRFRHSYFGTEHFLLGILAQNSGPVADLLASRSIDPGSIRQAILEALGFMTPNKPAMDKPDPVSS